MRKIPPVKITSTRLRTLALAALLAGSVVALSGCSAVDDLLSVDSPSAETRDDEGAIVEGGDTDVFQIAVGDCITDAGGQMVSDVPTVPCAEPHQYEVYAEGTMDDGDFPGDAAIDAKVDEICGGAFPGFVGMAYEESTLDYTAYTPSADTWARFNDRLITCIITDTMVATTTGTLAGAAR